MPFAVGRPRPRPGPMRTCRRCSTMCALIGRPRWTSSPARSCARPGVRESPCRCTRPSTGWSRPGRQRTHERRGPPPTGRQFLPPGAFGLADGDMRVCVVGCGAVGLLFAAALAQLADVEVWAYDLDQAHVDAINEHGLVITG